MRWVILWLLTTLVATCGQKGPLYLPEETPEATARTRGMLSSASSTNDSPTQGHERNSSGKPALPVTSCMWNPCPYRRSWPAVGSPVYVYSRAYFESRFNDLSKRPWPTAAPAAAICYAVKANSNLDRAQAVCRPGCGIRHRFRR